MIKIITITFFSFKSEKKIISYLDVFIVIPIYLNVNQVYRMKKRK